MRTYPFVLGALLCLAALTAGAEGPRVILELPSLHVTPGDAFYLRSYLDNPDGPALEQAPVVFLMGAEGHYWFWPSWSGSLDYLRQDVPVGTERITVIPEFLWPDLGEAAGAATFYGAILSSDLTALVGEMDAQPWSFGPTFSVAPAEVELLPGEDRLLVVVGAQGACEWWLEPPGLGVLATETEHAVTLTAGAKHEAGRVYVRDGLGQEASALVSVDLGPRLDPGEVDLVIGESLELAVLGGEPPYDWTLEDDEIAWIKPAGATCRVTATALGDTVLRVRDGDGREAAAPVHVACPEILITPENPTVKVDKEIQFSAAGGTPPYVWATDFFFLGTIDETGLFRGGPFTGVTGVTATDANGCQGRTEVTVEP